MQDLEEAYRRGVEPQLIRLLSVLPNLEAGEADAVRTVRNVSHQLKGSGSSFGHPEVTSLAAAVLAAPDSELAEAAKPLISAIEEVLATDKSLRRILIVDDDPLIRMIVTKTIEAPGRTFETAGSLAEARKAMDATTDLVLLDLLLPDGDGRQLLRYAQGNPETARIPVVVLSGSGSDPIRQAAMNAGAAGFVEKPFDPKSSQSLSMRCSRRAPLHPTRPRLVRPAARTLIGPPCFSLRMTIWWQRWYLIGLRETASRFGAWLTARVRSLRRFENHRTLRFLM
jgi:CheY-like chemotaxis protein